MNPPYGLDHTEDCLCLIFKLADGKSTGDSRFSGAKKGGAATLTERSDTTFGVKQFSPANGE